MEYGFEEVTIVDAPDNFVSFQNNNEDVTGYKIDTALLSDTPSFGKGSVTSGTVTFGEDDVFVYDKNGTVYYTKGYEDNGRVYYNATTYANTSE